MIANNIFNTVSGTALYRITAKIYTTASTISSYNFIATNGTNAGNGSEVTLQTVAYVGRWTGVDFTVTVPKLYRHMRLDPTNSATNLTQLDIYIKDLHAYNIKKAEVQDSDINWAGRRTSYYEGTKITSTDINVDSADTIDGGPVITVNTVNSDTPSSNPIGTSVIITGTNNTNTSQ